MYHLPGLCLHSMYDVGYMFVCMAVRVCLCAWVGVEGQTLIAKADAVLEKVGIPLAPGQCDSATKAMRQQVSGSMCVLVCVYIYTAQCLTTCFPILAWLLPLQLQHTLTFHLAHPGWAIGEKLGFQSLESV